MSYDDCKASNTIKSHEVAEELLVRLERAAEEQGFTLQIKGTGKAGEEWVRSINPEAIPMIADTVLSLFADMIAAIIDAGSERDAVNENETLLNELTKELTGWAI